MGKSKTNGTKQISHIGDLVSDSRNPRAHNARNIAQIERSLEQFGAARSIVVDEDGHIIAGNGLVEAAGNVGIERVKVVEADGNEVVAVVRRGLTPEQKKALSVADNRASELAEWDLEVLQELSQEIDLKQFWFEDELQALLAGASAMQETKAMEPPTDLEFRVIVECESEQEQAMLLQRLEREGLKCKALIS